MVTSTVFGIGGGGNFSTITVNTPFSHFAVIADTLQFSGSLNFLVSFGNGRLSSLIYLHPSSSPSSRFLFPLLLITNVFSSSTVTCNTIASKILSHQQILRLCTATISESKWDWYLNIRFGEARNVHVEYVFLRGVENISGQNDAAAAAVEVVAVIKARRR